ncbi:MAG: AsmA family protein, partial [Alphaproteobacteria bacterium]|nr:AsmA family protein [Alphaproteobacteria bacterium]
MTVGKIAAIVGGLVVLAVVALGAVLASLDFNDMKGLVAEKVKEATGRELVMAGDLDLELSLSPSLTLRQVSFKNAAWGSRPEMARLAHFSAEVALMPLISGNIEVKRLVLDGLELILETDTKGQGNWVFDTAGKAGGEAGEAAAGSGALPKVDNVLVKNIKILWRDGQSKESREINIAKLEAKAAEAGKIALSFAVSLAGQIISGSGQIGAPERLMDTSAPYPIDLELQAAGAKIKVVGSIAKPMEGAGLDLKLEVAGQDLKALGAVLGAELPLGGPYALKTGLKGLPAAVALDGLALKLAGSDLGGSLKLDLSGPRPGVAGKLAANLIDLTPLMPTAPAKTAKPAESAKKGDRVFPDDPLPLDALSLVDIDLSLSAKTVKARKLVLNDLVLKLSNAGGKAELKLSKARLEKAQLSARLALSELAGTPRVSTRYKVKALDVGKLLKDLEITDLLVLRADANGDLAGSGGSVRALMAGLSGKA